jgi:hypothetical protein
VLPKHRQMYGTVARNTGKRKEAEPLMLDTTTAWQPGERSIAEQAADRYAHLPVEEAVRSAASSTTTARATSPSASATTAR